ncbi:MAG: adenosine deaminase, partial [Candidatus Hydrogenedentota bacterium]
MSPVKFVHVLKRLEVLDRDIAELRAIEDMLKQNRTYSEAMKIAVELQINHLLNERVKL